jgi:WD40-like Beta Propeller Repeat
MTGAIAAGRGGALGLVVVGVLAACASGGGRQPADDAGPVDAAIGDAPAGSTLSIAPLQSDVTVMNGAAARVTFTATLTLADGTMHDVTGQTRFAIEVVHGSFAGNELSVISAGRSQVVATYIDRTATAQVTTRVKSVRIDSGLAPDVAALFEGTASAGFAPQIVYPPADTVMPRNLGDFEVHWNDSHGNTVFEIAMRTELSDVRAYVRGGNGLPSQGPTPSFASLTAKEWLAAVGLQGAVTYQLRGVSSARPGVVGTAAERTLPLSSQIMDGAMYYWATATTASAIGVFRHDMAEPETGSAEFLTTSKTAGRCIACHVLSRDGTRMAITFQEDGVPPGPSTMVDVKTRALAPATQVWNFGTFTPDNAQFLSVQAGTLVVRDATSQEVLATMPVTPTTTPRVKVTHPDLSPDGTRLVYVRTVSANSDFDFQQGQIYTRSYTQATRTFGPEVPLVNDGLNNFYPSWSPDGQWIVFNKNGAAGNAYDDANTSAWVVKADGSQPPVQLGRANQALGLTNSWVRWAPFAQTLATGESMYWITMSSKRDFGVRLRNTGVAQRLRRAQLWMTPFFPGRAAAGMDPSLAAFRLPFQSFESSNHLAQWTERLVEPEPVIE